MQYGQYPAPRFTVAHLSDPHLLARFWALVETRTPHREAAQDWLRLNGSTLLRIG